MPYRSSLLLRFNLSISQVEELLLIHNYLQAVPATQVTDNILRAALTMIVSAIDTCIHELMVNAIMFEMKENKSIFKINNINVEISISREQNQEDRLRLIESALRRQFAKEAFQSSRQIESALATIGISKIWRTLSATIGNSPEAIKLKLDLLVRRRNQIVHEGDLDHLHNLRDIGRQDIENALNFARELVSGIMDEYTKLIAV